MKRLFVVIAALAFLGASNARAEEKDKPKSRRETFISQRILDRLSLTAEQRTKAKELRDQFAKEAEDWKAAHKADREELRKERRATRASGDKAKLKELETKWNDLFKPLQDLRKQYTDKLRAELTDEQQKKLKEEMEHARQRWTERRGGGKEDKDDED